MLTGLALRHRALCLLGQMSRTVWFSPKLASVQVSSKIQIDYKKTTASPLHHSGETQSNLKVASPCKWGKKIHLSNNRSKKSRDGVFFAYQVMAFKGIKNRNLVENGTTVSISTDKSDKRRKGEEMNALESLNKSNKIRKLFRRTFKMSFIVRILQVAFSGIIQEELCCKTLINSLPQVPKYFLK